MLKHDVAWKREVFDDAARLQVPLGIGEGPRGVAIQLLKFPHRLSEQKPRQEPVRERSFLLGPAHQASPALIPAVSHKPPPRPDTAGQHDSQCMRGFPALVLQLFDALMLLPAMVPDGISELGVCLGNTVPQAPDLIIRQVFP